MSFFVLACCDQTFYFLCQVPFCGNGVRCIGKYLGENYKELTGNIINPSLLVSNYKIKDDNIYFNSPNPTQSTSAELDKLKQDEKFALDRVMEQRELVMAIKNQVYEMEK